MARITELPVELFLHIFGCWDDSVQELSALSCCSRFLHWVAFGYLFSIAFQRRCQRDEPRQVFMKLVSHAIKCDSQHITQWLCYHELSKELNSFIPSDSDSTNTVTYLHLSIIGDAPRVANHLVRYGTDVWEGGGDYPDITPLYLAIANPRGAKILDAALRIACSYAFPRTCRYLLTRGADPNSLSRSGLAAIHLAVRKRLPWRKFESVARLVHGEASSSDWGASLTRTAAVLLRFGADPNLRSATQREHLCGHKCWLSPDCEHRGQAVLHYACAGAPTEVIGLLLQHGADPKAADHDGYLPLYSALCQDHNEVALQLLQDDVDQANLIIVQAHQSTALHIACRFACLEVISFLLERGADANATAPPGVTPLHELLGQRSLELKDRVPAILAQLDTYGAVAEIRPQAGGPTARELAMVHPFSSVRQFFDPVERTCRGSEPFQVQESTWSAPPTSTASSGRVQNHRRRNKRRSGPRKGLGATASMAGQNGVEKPSSAVGGVKGSRMSESATFWSTLASSRQEPNHEKVETTREQRKEDKRDGFSHRGKRGNKWAPLRIS